MAFSGYLRSCDLISFWSFTEGNLVPSWIANAALSAQAVLTMLGKEASTNISLGTFGGTTRIYLHKNSTRA